MPIPAPTAPRPTPTPKAIALPRSARPASVVAARVRNMGLLSVLGFDCAADVDGGEKCEDESLDGHDDPDLEQVDRDAEADRERREPDRLEDEDEADHDQQ